MSVVVIGLGDAFRRDDAAGLEVARLVSERSSGVRVVAHEGDAAALLDAWSGAELAIVIDAVRAGAPSGDVVRIVVGDDDTLPAEARDSSHALGLHEAIGLAKALDRMPAKLVVYGIVARDTSAGAGLSAEVAAAVDDIADAIVEEVREVASCA